MILSAGQGSRLGALTERTPKCLLSFAGRTLLDWQLAALRGAGVSRVAIVAGFQADAVRQRAAAWDAPGFACGIIENTDYATTENIVSAWMAREVFLAGNTLLLNGDTIISGGLVRRVLAQIKAPVSVSVDRKPVYDDDDMKVCLDGTQVQAIGKTLLPQQSHAEAIGLSIYAGSGGRQFIHALETMAERPDGRARYYLSAVDALARQGQVGAVSIGQAPWAEVDFPHDLEKAEHAAAKCAACPDTANGFALASLAARPEPVSLAAE